MSDPFGSVESRYQRQHDGGRKFECACSSGCSGSEAVGFTSDEVYYHYQPYLTGCADFCDRAITEVAPFTPVKPCREAPEELASLLTDSLMVINATQELGRQCWPGGLLPLACRAIGSRARLSVKGRPKHPIGPITALVRTRLAIRRGRAVIGGSLRRSVDRGNSCAGD